MRKMDNQATALYSDVLPDDKHRLDKRNKKAII